jgi:hypothetical protein
MVHVMLATTWDVGLWMSLLLFLGAFLRMFHIGAVVAISARTLADFILAESDEMRWEVYDVSEGVVRSYWKAKELHTRCGTPTTITMAKLPNLREISYVGWWMELLTANDGDVEDELGFNLPRWQHSASFPAPKYLTIELFSFQRCLLCWLI